MNKTLNKYLAKHHSVKLDANGSVIEIFKGELDNLVLDEKVLATYKDAKSVIDVPNSFQMWETLRSENMFDDEIVDLYDMYINFLKTPLTLNMFIAVENEPDPNDDYYRDANGITEEFYEDLKRFQDATKRVLFYGWRFSSTKGSAMKPTFYLKDTYENSLVVFGGGEIRCNGVLVEVVGDLIGRISLIAKIAA